MRIGIDIDGVLTDIEQWQLDYSTKFYYEKYKKEIINDAGYDTKDIFNCEKAIDEEFWNEHFRDYSLNIAARKFSGEVIKKLKEENYEIYIITARGSFLSHSTEVMSVEENQNIVKEWLRKNNINYDEIIFSQEDKLSICIEKNIDIMIEDKPKNITDISTKIPVICFDANYNKDCNGNNVIRCYSWYDIYAKINNIRKYSI